ncbi:MAG: hypothetical protein E7316_07255 [Clostridiales bacterium]|nr:hypothetical protein [Clostridiales bacterium]
MSYTNAEQKTIDEIRVLCVGLFTYILDDMDAHFKLVQRRAEHYDRTGQFTDDGSQPKRNVTAGSSKAGGIFFWLFSTIGKLLAISFHGVQPEWISFDLPNDNESPLVFSTADPEVLEKIHSRILALKGIHTRVAICINALIEKIQASDHALLKCYQHLKTIPTV